MLFYLKLQIEKCKLKILFFQFSFWNYFRRSLREEKLHLIRHCPKSGRSLASLRNRSPLGHGFKRVSLEKIQEELSEFTFETINDLLITAGIKINNPYSKINKFLRKEIEDY